jgi:hypothetical protein
VSVPNRKDVRDAFASLLIAQVADAQRLYPLTNDEGNRVTQPEQFGGESPVIVVASSGTGRAQLTFRGQAPVIYLDVYTFARADDDASDDRLDDIEAQIADVIAEAQNRTHWTAIDYDGRSQTEFVKLVTGTLYKRELTALKFTARM